MEYEGLITVFTKPWKEPGLEELAAKVAKLGFGGVELTVRPGYQVEPGNAHQELKRAVEIFARSGLRIESVATELSEQMIESCERAGVPLLRTMLPVNPRVGYAASIESFRERCHKLEPILARTGVRVGVQNHCGDFVGSAMGIMEAISPLSERFVVVLDFAHTTLAGEPEPYAMEIALPRLGMVNLKNAVLEPGPSNEHGETTWERRWVTATEGITSWSCVASLIQKHGYTGPVCLTAEYKDSSGRSVTGDHVNALVQKDLLHLKALISKL